jgi:uncharacterized protein YcbX
MSPPAIELSGIYIYPVKSLRGIGLEHARTVDGRLAGDREWLLIDRHGRFMHQRDYPQMTRIATAVAADGITVSMDGLPPLEVRRHASSPIDIHSVVHVRLWRRRAAVASVGEDADSWFTRALGVRCRLMAFVPDVPALDLPSYETNSSLQDATPFHLTSESSLADLNARMTTPIPMNRFRPNVVVRGSDPYAEDGWKRIAVGDMVLEWIKPCTRCVATTTDQHTGARASQEPLRTLARYRRVGNEVSFGHYLVASTWGDAISIGDSVTELPTR